MVIFHTIATTFPNLKSMLPGLTQASRKRIFSSLGQALRIEARNGADKRHALARHPSKSGGGFWAKLRDSTSFVADENGVTIGSSHEAATHKQMGGTISAPGKGKGATGARALTIPISELSRGKNVRQMRKRFVIFRMPGTDVLFGATKNYGSSTKGKIFPLFVLKKSVKQRAEPWFPDEDAARREMSKVLRFHTEAK
jgi:hypothetical protein